MNIDPSRPLFTRAGQYVSDYCTHVAGVAANLGVGRCGTTQWRSLRMLSVRIVVQTGNLADDTLVELHGEVPHPTTPGFAVTSSYIGAVVTGILIRSGEY